MALMKEPYGLVYNTDGSLCTTYRDDNVPFRGVRSFAVETATTNYWNNDITDYAYQISSGDVTFENTVYNGRPALKCIVTGTDPYIKVAFKHSAGNINPGDTYTASIGVAALSSEITGLVDTAAYIYFTRLGFIGFARPDHDWGKAGNRIYATYTHPTIDTTPFYACVFLKEAGTFYLYDYQLEKKPFASSFVEGSRSVGRLRVGIDDLRDGRLYNHVLTFWFKVPPISTYELGNWPGRVGIVGNRVTPDYYGYSDYGIFIESNGNLNFRAMNNPEGSRTLSFPQIPKGEYENRWNNVVIVFDEDDNLVRHYKIYFNGEYHGYADVTRMDNYYFHAKPDTFYFYNNYLRSHLLANIFIGKYKRTDGTVIWTEDYIREVYEAQIPFPVSNKLSIY